MITTDYFMQKWNLQKAKYEPYTKPEENGWYCPIYCNDMKELVNCTECGKQVEYGNTFTSRFIHNRTAFGFPVCYECNIIEFELENDFMARIKKDCK